MVKNAAISSEKADKTAGKKPSTPAAQHSTRQQDGFLLQHLQCGVLPANLRPADILRLQRSVGNRAVGAWLRGSAQARQVIQAKLVIGQPADQYEQEADRIAAQVVDQINASAPNKLTQEQPEQHLALSGNNLQTKPVLQLREAVHSGEASAHLESAINRAKGSGRPLDKGLQQSMGQAMGADFSGVRVHADAQADRLSQSIQAKAFTTGQDVFFRQGEYEPGSRSGQALIAHELTHVVQQARRELKPSIQGNKVMQRQARSTLVDVGMEREKEEMTGNSRVPLSKELTSLAINPVAIVQSTTQKIVQRVVFQDRKTKKWYSHRDEKTRFNTKEDAQKYDREFSSKEKEEITMERKEKKEKRLENKKRELDEKYVGYIPPKAKIARLYKNQDKAFDDVDYTVMTPDNVKVFMEKKLEERRAGAFTTQIIEFGNLPYVIAPGTDIGVTPALLRPDVEGTPEGLIPLSREGTAKPNTDLYNILDQIVRNNTPKEQDVKDTRQRVGKDIMRITRNSPVEGSIKYTAEELKTMTEVAVILREDKGRVPNATKYIKNTFTDGSKSFSQLLKDYVGAGKGGVENLRGKQEEKGYESEGSDIESNKKSGKEEEEEEEGANEMKISGGDYHPTNQLNEQLNHFSLKLIWIEPNGFCIFNSLGAVTGIPGKTIQASILDAIDNNTNNIRSWITDVYGGEGHETVESARFTVENIMTFWGEARADIVLPLAAEVLKMGFTVIQDNQEPIFVNSGGRTLVRVKHPHEHYHATSPM